MLMRTDPFGVVDQLTQQLFRGIGSGWGGAGWGGGVLPLDAYRQGDRYVVHVDLPGVDASAVELSVERNVLTIKAERTWTPGEDAQRLIAERPQGVVTRQLYLGDALDIEHIEAHYDAGVLTVMIPVAETAKPRKVEITAGQPAVAEGDTKALAS